MEQAELIEGLEAMIAPWLKKSQALRKISQRKLIDEVNGVLLKLKNGNGNSASQILSAAIERGREILNVYTRRTAAMEIVSSLY